VAVDSSGNIFIADTGNGAIRKVGPDGTITTVLRGFTDPTGVAVDAAGGIYIAAADENGVFKSDSPGNITRLGSGWNVPWAVVSDAAGNVYAADSHAHRIRKVSPDGSTIDIAGTGLIFPLGVALDAAANLYIADAGNNRIQRVSNSDTERRIPTFSDASITNAASFVPGSGLAPGGLITIFGSNLTNVSGIVTAGEPPFRRN
jgi:sugar lactone lactonase YvrE